ncbi:hypothetical protein R69927_05619 [Paraburkholderia domus]|nr:hypothetical protein R69927_05619 [Paraburkholderia domus]
MALKYIRKAADLGNADAQYYVADLLFPHDKAPDIARQMQQCAADQGHGKAALELGTDLKYIKQYHDALSALQKGVAAGNSISAMVLEKSFLAPPATDEGFYLGLPDDPERSHRYKLIGKFLDLNQLNNPTVPDIDRIVPLPPAQLPAWDGTFEWEKKQAEIPPKPSDELINRLAKEKNLDPATGLPLSAAASQTSQAGKPAKLARVPLGTKMRAGARCPESGEWCTQILAELRGETTQYFRKGETLPMLDVYRPRTFAWLDSVLGRRRYTTDVIWTLTAYNDKA